MTDLPQRRHLGPLSAMGICVASMIGSGIFIVPGEIGPQLGSGLNIMIAWTLGGVLALCGGLIVAELAAANPRAGAVYMCVRDALGHGWGWFFGMTSVVVGYFASLAVVALAAAGYVRHFLPELDERLIATLIIALPAIAHGTRVLAGTLINDVLVGLKVGIVAAFVVAGLAVSLDTIPPPPDEGPEPDVVSAPMGAAIVRITFAYLGWSAVNVVAGEVKRPERTLPLAVIGSVVLVCGAYLLMNLVYLKAVAPGSMGDDIGAVAAAMIFGESVGDLIVLAIILLIVSTGTTMLFTGSRLVLAMAWKGELPRRLGRLNHSGAPSMSVLVYALIAVGMLWIAPVGTLLDYAGLLTTTCMAMMAITVLAQRRRQQTRPFSMPLFPAPVVITLALAGWLIVSSALEDPVAALASAGTIAALVILRPWLTGQRSHADTTYTDRP